MSRKALGKGLEAIFANMGQQVVDKKTGSGVMEIALASIQPNPFQPRREFNAEAIAELANSIGEKGLLQPILLRKHGEGYQIVAGERRFRATQKLGRTHIPALVREQLTDRDMMEMALIENIQRVQLSPIEEARAYEQLINECGITHEDIAQRLSKSRSAVTNTLRLLKLEDEIQTLIREGNLTAGHGRALLQVEAERRPELVKKILGASLNVRDAESAGQKRPAKAPKSVDPNTAAFLAELRLLLGTKVTLRGTGKKGVLEIHFMNRDDLYNMTELMRAGHAQVHSA
jgi:ParB family chromosome partitioning protein